MFIAVDTREERAMWLHALRMAANLKPPLYLVFRLLPCFLACRAAELKCVNRNLRVVIDGCYMKDPCKVRTFVSLVFTWLLLLLALL